MYFLQVVCVLLIVTKACINADCPYQATLEKIEPCDNKQGGIFTILKPVNIKLSGDNCDISITGCARFNQEVKSAKCKWTAWKDNVPVSQGERSVCGFTLGKLKVNCPLKKGSSICAKEEHVKNPIGGKSMMTAVGKMKMKFECTSDAGSQCIMVEGKVAKK